MLSPQPYTYLGSTLLGLFLAPGADIPSTTVRMPPGAVGLQEEQESFLLLVKLCTWHRVSFAFLRAIRKACRAYQDPSLAEAVHYQ